MKVPFRLLYKYKSVEKLEQVKDILVNQRLWASPKSVLNDIAEGEFRYDPRGFEFFEAKYLKAIQEQIAKTNLVCLSPYPNSTKMWGHYGQSHTGVCIGVSLLPRSYECHSSIIYADKAVDIRATVYQTLKWIIFYNRTFPSKTKFVETLVNDILMHPQKTFTENLLTDPVLLRMEFASIHDTFTANWKNGLTPFDTIVNTAVASILGHKQKAWAEEQEERVMILNRQYLPVRVEQVMFGCAMDKTVKNSLQMLIDDLNQNGTHSIQTIEMKREVFLR